MKNLGALLKLTKNEKQALKLLLINSRITDSDIADKLSISSQAVGKIRRKLESSVIDSYSVNLNYAKLGVHIFAMSLSKITRDGLDVGELDVEQKLLNDPHIISVYRIPKGSSTHVILYGFQDMMELDNYFHSSVSKERLHQYIETQELFTFSHNSLLKNNPMQLFHKLIDNMGSKSSKSQFSEFERFKKRLV